jgi:polygalacturonase
MSLTKVSYSMIEGDPANVLDYGAIGDGVTDDTAAFIAALSDASVVFVPSGNYRVENLSVPSGKSLLGQDTRNTVLKLKSGSIFRVFVMTGQNDWSISNLTIDADTTGTSIALFTTCNSGSLSNVFGTGSAAHGLEFDNCSDCLIENVEVYSSWNFDITRCNLS